MRTVTHAFTVALLAFITTFTGCSTYVNIPPQTGDVAGNDPNVLDVVTVQAMAIRAVIEDRPSKRKYVFMLPPGSNTTSYRQVEEELGDLATHGLSLPDANSANSANVEGQAVKPPPVEVRQVMIRGWTSQIDIIRPSDPNTSGTPLQLVTVYLKWQFFDGWTVQRMHAWHIPVDAALNRSRLEADTETPVGPGANDR